MLELTTNAAFEGVYWLYLYLYCIAAVLLTEAFHKRLLALFFYV